LRSIVLLLMLLSCRNLNQYIIMLFRTGRTERTDGTDGTGGRTGRTERTDGTDGRAGRTDGTDGRGGRTGRADGRTDGWMDGRTDGPQITKNHYFLPSGPSMRISTTALTAKWTLRAVVEFFEQTPGRH